MAGSNLGGAEVGPVGEQSWLEVRGPLQTDYGIVVPTQFRKGIALVGPSLSLPWMELDGSIVVPYGGIKVFQRGKRVAAVDQCPVALWEQPDGRVMVWHGERVLTKRRQKQGFAVVRSTVLRVAGQGTVIERQGCIVCLTGMFYRTGQVQRGSVTGRDFQVPGQMCSGFGEAAGIECVQGLAQIH